ncbi:MAG: hypothetical protein L0Z50_06665 [Verrucomicrobiales bacterium]|nr:hypothetical protein [Verrucomicrobiales bacterium]
MGTYLFIIQFKRHHRRSAKYVYGTTTSDSDVASFDLLRAARMAALRFMERRFVG